MPVPTTHAIDVMTWHRWYWWIWWNEKISTTK